MGRREFSEARPLLEKAQTTLRAVQSSPENRPNVGRELVKVEKLLRRVGGAGAQDRWAIAEFDGLLVEGHSPEKEPSAAKRAAEAIDRHLSTLGARRLRVKNRPPGFENTPDSGNWSEV